MSEQAELPVKSVQVNTIDREEVLRFHSEVVRAVQARDRFIAYLARSYNVDLATHDFQVEAGKFIRRGDGQPS